MKTHKVTEILETADLVRTGSFLFESVDQEFHLYMKHMAKVVMVIIISKKNKGRNVPSIVKTLKDLREKVPIPNKN